MEILYYTNKPIMNIELTRTIRWLSVDDYDIFREHLILCEQQIVDNTEWREIYANGTVYCGLFADDKMIARACVEKYSKNAWEIADVRTAKQFRRNGYAFDVCSYVLNYILNQGKTATIRTEENNSAMKRVIETMGFQQIDDTQCSAIGLIVNK